ncbi:DUF6538 domain-containing protein [Pseudorhodobacter sp. W20_MBD10_FR17]|uniref:DUF6538 domain-containing protein n=1 Tax=Pseudorhodobacter sp. W20_MBD10_FR17 TaxID=3240266 RepID=UPI003F9DF21C
MSVPGTKLRGNIYYMNLAIPVRLRHLYPGKKMLTDTLRTTDPKVAKDAVTVAKAEFIKQSEALEKVRGLDAQLADLTPEQRTMYENAGGLEGLLSGFKRSQTARTFILAGGPAHPDPASDEDDVSADPLQDKIALAEHEAALSVLDQLARAEGKVLNKLGKKVDLPGGEVEGLEELATRFISANDWTIQNAESLRYTVRRWVEFHGDIGLSKLTLRHLADFDEAAKGLPTSTEKRIRALPMKRAVQAAQKEKLPTIAYKTRLRLIDHLKALSKFAKGKGLIAINPWADYSTEKPKEAHGQKKKRKVPPFTSSELRLILDHVQMRYDKDVMDYWLPFLAAYGGARREELGQLLISDVITSGNIPYLNITDDDPLQKVKNKHSVRGVPIPPALIEMGFMEFVERRRKAGGRFLFQEDYVDKRKNVTRREVQPDRRGRLFGGPNIGNTARCPAAHACMRERGALRHAGYHATSPCNAALANHSAHRDWETRA